MNEFIAISIVSFGLLIFGFLRKDFTIASLAGIFIMVFGIGIMIGGINAIPKFVIEALGIIYLALGAYILIRGSIEVFKNYKWIGFKKAKKVNNEK